MNLLLDSPIILWWLADDPRLSSKARALIENANEARVGTGHQNLHKKETVEKEGLQHVPIAPEHAIPRHPRDPFDRLLVAQAKLEGLKLLTKEQILARYGPYVVLV